MAQKADISKLHGFFSATTESGKPLLKELLHNTSKQQEAFSIFVSRIPFQALSGFKWILVNHVGANLLKFAAASWLTAAQPQNNHTETVLIKSLLGSLALASY